MAKTFNGSIWGNLGNTIFREDALRRERNQDSMNNLMDAAKFIEKTNANRKLREDWQKYFQDRQAAADIATALDTENALALESAGAEPPASNIFGIKEEPAASIWDPDMIANGYSVAGGDSNAHFMDSDDYFMANFDPNTASPEEIKRAQAIIGTTPDGLWGRRSRMAFSKYKGV